MFPPRCSDHVRAAGCKGGLSNREVVQVDALDLGVAHPIHLQHHHQRSKSKLHHPTHSIACVRLQTISQWNTHRKHHKGAKRLFSSLLQDSSTYLPCTFSRLTNTQKERNASGECLLTWKKRRRLSRPAVMRTWPSGWNSTLCTTAALGSAILASRTRVASSSPAGSSAPRASSGPADASTPSRSSLRSMTAFLILLLHAYPSHIWLRCVAAASL